MLGRVEMPRVEILDHVEALFQIGCMTSSCLFIGAFSVRGRGCRRIDIASATGCRATGPAEHPTHRGRTC